jgi:hypothetical protein
MDHVADKVAVSRSIDDGVVKLGSEKLLHVDINSDTTVTLGLVGIERPGKLEARLSGLRGLLLELAESTVVKTSAKVKKVSMFMYYDTH